MMAKYLGGKTMFSAQLGQDLSTNTKETDDFNNLSMNKTKMQNLTHFVTAG